MLVFSIHIYRIDDVETTGIFTLIACIITRTRKVYYVPFHSIKS